MRTDSRAAGLSARSQGVYHGMPGMDKVNRIRDSTRNKRRKLSMNKTELVAAIAEKAELSKKDSEKALTAFVEVVTED